MTADSEYTSVLRSLAAAGARVRLYPDTSAALYIHAKLIVADGARAFVGSQNFSTASLQYNRELGVLTADPVVIAAVQATFNRDLAGADALAAQASG
jgi:phosphatidylserine/phosphatidylglycerophosphate/cardiolipin synthase-like enzyme